MESFAAVGAAEPEAGVCPNGGTSPPGASVQLNRLNVSLRSRAGFSPLLSTKPPEPRPSSSNPNRPRGGPATRSALPAGRVVEFQPEPFVFGSGDTQII